ncbi:hypothetical protein, conserved [Babesia bigemina]|uniref:Uncharacterized protein n=1 Tax=Babesia bigemina TaxID=5866 RepID=A0A061DEC3_BABBI|nr:hypothetical protein, conserved [Babesia bigemina]CDR97030.1 hypothetical protein, conserved [Babesia bigemina]|eukprot:XP_012769216.1 hypothetical protein, conserved [Babesia bigemina]
MLVRRVARRSFSSVPTSTTGATSDVATGSKYEESSCLAKVHHVEGIWRAPRKLPYTKEEFDRAYPPNYQKMRIGLPDSGTVHAKYIDPRYDEMSPLVWTGILMSPIIIWGGIETYYHYFPGEPGGHH